LVEIDHKTLTIKAMYNVRGWSFRPSTRGSDVHSLLSPHWRRPRLLRHPPAEGPLRNAHPQTHLNDHVLASACRNLNAIRSSVNRLIFFSRTSKQSPD